ncbi:MAG: hypothetical protein Q9199_002648 [Rusavskia elegans]
MLGCVPRSPSPIPQESHLEEAVTKPDDPQEQLRALRAQLAELENRITNTPQSIVKSEQLRLTSTVKREREDNENEVKQKRSPQYPQYNYIRGGKPIIDLCPLEPWVWSHILPLASNNFADIDTAQELHPHAPSIPKLNIPTTLDKPLLHYFKNHLATLFHEKQKHVAKTQGNGKPCQTDRP